MCISDIGVSCWRVLPPPLGRLVAAIRADHPSMAPQALIGRARSIVNLAGCCSHVPCAAESG